MAWTGGLLHAVELAGATSIRDSLTSQPTVQCVEVERSRITPDLGTEFS